MSVGQNRIRRGRDCLAPLCCLYVLFYLIVIAIPETARAADPKNIQPIAGLTSIQKKNPPSRQTGAASGTRPTADELLKTAERLRLEWTSEAFRLSIETYGSARAFFEKAGNKRGAAQALLGAGEVLAISGEQDQALAQYGRALSFVYGTGDTRLEVNILNRMAEIEIDKHDRACELHAQRSRELAERTGYTAGLAGALNNLGVIAYTKNDDPNAVDYFQRALSLWTNEGNLAGQAEALTSLGLTYGTSGSVNKAREFLDRAFESASAAGDRRKQARISLALALVLKARGQWQKALELYRGTVLSLRQWGDKANLAVALNGLGSMYEELGEMSQSLANFKESLLLSHNMRYPRREAIALLHIASIYSESGRQREALSIYRKLLRIAPVLKDAKVEVYALNDAGLIYESLGEFLRARGCYDRAATVSNSLNHPRGQAYSKYRLGSLCLRMNKLAEANAQLSAALSLMTQVGDRTGEMLVLYDIARLKHQRGEADNALLDVRQIIKSAESLRAEMLSPDLKATYFGLTHKNYELLVDLLMQKHLREPASGNDIAALEASEFGRARSLTETLLQTRAELTDGVPKELLDKENTALVKLRKKAAEEMDLRETRFRLTQTKPAENESRAERLSQNSEAIESVSREITELTAQLDQATTEIAANRPRKYANLLRAPHVGLDQLQDRLLDADTLALEYSLGEERSYLWIIRHDSLTSYVLPRRAEIESQAYSFYKALTSISNDRTNPGGRRRSLTAFKTLEAARDRLSRTLLAPIEGLAGSKRLVIIPDGALQYVPFAALLEPGANQPLVVRHELASLPSLSVLCEIRDDGESRPSAAKALAVFADPVVDENDPRFSGKRVKPVSRSRLRTGGTRRSVSPFEEVRNPFNSTGVDEALNFIRLPFAAEEAAMLESLVPDSDRLVRTGFEANRQTATGEGLSNFRMVHFATHGLLDFRHPKLSCLVLSRFNRDGEPQDGYLRLQDIYNMKLSADLVVLSACQTALGKQIRGEGLVGLTRGFLYAGVARVVASLWNVDDNASAKLMERFYKKMLGPERLSASAALRAAQVEMMREKRWKDPYYWAAFILQGEWR